MESKTTSNSNWVKALLIRGWRERWTDSQWGINLQTALPEGASADDYDLTDWVFHQGAIRPIINRLMFGYLKHSLTIRLVSHAAVLQRLSKYSQLNYVHIVLGLLEFLEEILPGVTVGLGNLEKTELPTAVLSVALWLLNILQQCQSTKEIIAKAGEILKSLLTDDFCVSMMCLARYNDPELFTEITRNCMKLEQSLTEVDEISKYVRELGNINSSVLQLQIYIGEWPGSLIQCWLDVEFAGNPGSTTTVLCRKLFIFQQIKGYSEARLYAELMRGSLLSLYNARGTSQESQWGAFTFLKLPRILLQLAEKYDSMCMVNAVELLLEHGPLLDKMDANSTCSNFKCLLDELAKSKLISEQQTKILLEKREAHPSLSLELGPGSNGKPTNWRCAESTLRELLEILSSDYHKVHDALLRMCHDIISAKSFEHILAVANIQDKLRTLVNGLIRFNECSKSGEDTARSQLFDNTFLMLVTIVQNYGSSAVLNPDGGSFIEQWVKSCMVERQRLNLEHSLELCDPAVIKSLLRQFHSGESDFKSDVKWQDVLFNIAGVMHWVFMAWEQGALAEKEVTRIIAAVRGKMFCLRLAAIAWLCSQMKSAPKDTLKKLGYMVRQLLAPSDAEEDGFRDKYEMTQRIVKKMVGVVLLPPPKLSSNHLKSNISATEQFSSVWESSIERGWLDHDSVKTLHCLLGTAGDRWLVSAVIQELLVIRSGNLLQRGVDLALAIFHVDIVGCTQQLLSHFLLRFSFKEMRPSRMMEPMLLALATLTSYSVYAAWDSLSEDIEVEPPLAKKPRLTDTIEDPVEQLLTSLRHLLHMLQGEIRKGFIISQTYFACYLVNLLVEVKVKSANAVLAAIPSSLVSELLNTVPKLFSYSLLLHLHDIFKSSGRINMKKDLCVLRNYYLKNAEINRM